MKKRLSSLVLCILTIALIGIPVQAANLDEYGNRFYQLSFGNSDTVKTDTSVEKTGPNRHWYCRVYQSGTTGLSKKNKYACRVIETSTNTDASSSTLYESPDGTSPRVIGYYNGRGGQWLWLHLRGAKHGDTYQNFIDLKINGVYCP